MQRAPRLHPHPVALLGRLVPVYEEAAGVVSYTGAEVQWLQRYVAQVREVARTSVVLPDCLGPVTVTTGYQPAGSQQ